MQPCIIWDPKQAQTQPPIWVYSSDQDTNVVSSVWTNARLNSAGPSASKGSTSVLAALLTLEPEESRVVLLVVQQPQQQLLGLYSRMRRASSRRNQSCRPSCEKNNTDILCSQETYLKERHRAFIRGCDMP